MSLLILNWSERKKIRMNLTFTTSLQPPAGSRLALTLPPAVPLALVLVEMFKAHLVMIQRKSANPYARETSSR